MLSFRPLTLITTENPVCPEAKSCVQTEPTGVLGKESNALRVDHRASLMRNSPCEGALSDQYQSSGRLQIKRESELQPHRQLPHLLLFYFLSHTISFSLASLPPPLPPSFLFSSSWSSSSTCPLSISSEGPLSAPPQCLSLALVSKPVWTGLCSLSLLPRGRGYSSYFLGPWFGDSLLPTSSLNGLVLREPRHIYSHKALEQATTAASISNGG